MSKRRHRGRVARPSSHASHAHPIFSPNHLAAALFGLTLGVAFGRKRSPNANTGTEPQ